jgi:hypothetical protein
MIYINNKNIHLNHYILRNTRRYIIEKHQILIKNTIFF